MTVRIWPGKPHPLGAVWDGSGVNFALFSEHARQVELCLFDSPQDRQESARVALTEQTDGVWHGYLPDVRPGQLYGYRVSGTWDPSSGHRFNPNKVLLDPCAGELVEISAGPMPCSPIGTVKMTQPSITATMRGAHRLVKSFTPTLTGVTIAPCEHRGTKR